MVAKQKIVPGDVLMVDTAYATSLFEDYYKSHCNHCFLRIKEEPINCPTCSKVSCFLSLNSSSLLKQDLRANKY